MDCRTCTDKECTAGKDCFGLSEEVRTAYVDDDLAMARLASHIEASGYMKLCRVEELIAFAQEMGYRKLGIAFCIGLAEEARLLGELLQDHFEVSSVCCKVCGISKDDFGFEHVRPGGFEAMCDPIGQAICLNREGTDLNIICGLCIGHDILFSKHSEAPVTTIVVKDRVLAHNPVGALYSRYYRNKIIQMTPKSMQNSL